MAAGGSNKAVIAALLANAVIAVAKFVGFLITTSSSMLAESIHSVADSANQGLLLLGGKRARRAATEEHPFGFGRERYFWAFVVTVVLFLLGGVFALYEGYHKLQEPGELTSPLVAVVILVVGLIAEGFSLRLAVRESRKVKGDESWWSFIRHSRSPELPVVLLEDLGAEIGLALALGGVGMVVLTGNGEWDAYATLAIGVLLIIIAIVLAIEMKSLLIGEGARPRDVLKIRQAIGSTPGVASLHHLKTVYLGPEELLVAASVEIEGGRRTSGVASVIDAAEQAIRGAVPAATVTYIEPDLHADGDSAAVGPSPAAHREDA